MINNRNAGRRRGRGGQRQQGGGGGGRPESGNRIDNRARGNANQLLEKYKNLAAEAQRQGDRVNTEYYLQFADHYFRVLADNRARFEENNPQARRQREEAEDGFDDDFDGDTDGPSVEAGDRREERWNGQRNGQAPREDTETGDTAEPREAAEDDGDGWRRNRRARNRNRREDEAPRPAEAAQAEPEADSDGDGRLAVSVLPPSIQMGVEGEPARDDELPPTPPRRRGRPRKSEQPTEAAAE